MLNELLKQDTIKLVEPGHKYVVKQAEHLRFSSVTTFIHDFFEGFDAEKVANKLSGTGKYINTSVEELLADWEQSGIDGTKVHNQIEDAILQGHPFKAVKTNNLEAKTIHALEWLSYVIEPHYKLFPEVKIYSIKYQLAGTIDLLVYNTLTDQWLIVDWKTNKKINKYGFGGAMGKNPATRLLPDCHHSHYTLQLSLYQYLLKLEYGIEIEDRILVHLKPKKTNKFPMGITEYWLDYLKVNVENMLVQRLELKEANELFTI